VSQERSAVAESGMGVDPRPAQPPEGQVPASGQARASAIETVKAVLWSFFGVRGRAGHERDMDRLNPVYVILTGIVLAVLFVLGLIALVRWVVA
jgi:hypothetical protein